MLNRTMLVPLLLLLVGVWGALCTSSRVTPTSATAAASSAPPKAVSGL